MPRDEQTEHTVVAVDTEASSRPDRSDPIRIEMEDALGRMVTDALHRARIHSPRQTNTGDGIYIALPPQLPPVRALEPLVRYIGDGLRWHNQHYVQERARIRLRIAVDLGGATPYASFVRGPALLTAVTRLLDSQVLRDALGTNQETPFALLVSDDYYRRVVRQGFPGIDVDAYQSVEVSLKTYHEQAWLYVPGGAPSKPTAKPFPTGKPPGKASMETPGWVQQRGVVNLAAAGSQLGDIHIGDLRGIHDTAPERGDDAETWA